MVLGFSGSINNILVLVLWLYHPAVEFSVVTAVCCGHSANCHPYVFHPSLHFCLDSTYICVAIWSVVVSTVRQWGIDPQPQALTDCRVICLIILWCRQRHSSCKCRMWLSRIRENPSSVVQEQIVDGGLIAKPWTQTFTWLFPVKISQEKLRGREEVIEPHPILNIWNSSEELYKHIEHEPCEQFLRLFWLLLRCCFLLKICRFYFPPQPKETLVSVCQNMPHSALCHTTITLVLLFSRELQGQIGVDTDTVRGEWPHLTPAH